MSWIRRGLAVPWLAPLLAMLGGAYYAFSAFVIAHTKTSFLDEGQYLYKGLLFVSGVYKPYQDYGPWTNHTPLVFLIHGTIQKWFGPSLATGRFFMIGLGLLTCLGLWILARRWGGRWWAAGIVWALALNPASVKLYTLAISEGLIAPMLVWMLVLVLGVRRPLWQILLACVLAAVMLMTRVNLGFVLPLLVLYIFWRYGWKIGLLALLTGSIAVIGLHMFFWPNILKAWAWWLPPSLTPFLNQWRVPPDAFGVPYFPDETANPFTKFLYIWLTFRLHFIALGSALAVWLMWPRRRRPVTERVRAALFLSILLIVLYAAHLLYAYGSACVSCILNYAANFDFLGLILLAVAYRFLPRVLPSWRRVLLFFVGALFILGVGFSTYEDVDSNFAKVMIERMDRFYPWNVLQHFVPLPPLMLFRQTFAVLMACVTIVLLTVVLLVSIRRSPDRPAAARRLAFSALNLFLAAALVLSPTLILGKGDDFFDCGDTDVLASYQEAGNYLRGIIPAGSKIYWDGRLPAIFLYLPGVVVYPPQLNHVHGYFTGGDADILYRFSRWNDALAHEWIREADFVLLQKGYVQDWETQTVEGGGYIRLEPTRKLEKCQWQSVIDVYQRLKP